jgi:hypothetical protein
MKKMLIFLNLILAGVLVIVVISTLAQKSRRQVAAIDRQRKENSRKAALNKSVKAPNNERTAVDEQPVSLPAPDDAASMVVAHDVFNQVRSPLANVRMGRADMILVGVVEGKAAIIRSNTRQQQFNPYLLQAQMMTSNMNGRGFHSWSQMSGGRNTGPAQQYVRLNQTMNNGFTLKEVHRNRAVLVRGNDRMELTLQLPSKNRAAARAPRRLNQAQQFQQAQMYMQSQMIRSIREIQQNNRSAQQGNRNRR